MTHRASTSSVRDVATYILTKTGPLSAMKLHRLIYYGQAWSLVWDERALFTEPIHASIYGPVVRSLDTHHAGQFLVSPHDVPGAPDTLDAMACETLDAVVAFYGQHTAQEGCHNACDSILLPCAIQSAISSTSPGVHHRPPASRPIL